MITSQLDKNFCLIAFIPFILSVFICYSILRKFKHELTIYYLSMLHATFASIYSLIGLNILKNVNEYSIVFVIGGHVSLGYFCVDLINILLKKDNKNNIAMILHHIIFSLVIIWMIYQVKYHMFGLSVIFTELSTILLNFYHIITFYSKINNKFKKLIPLQVILFSVVFFTVRILFLSWLALTYYIIIFEDFILLTVCIFTLGINYYWFYKIFKKLLIFF